MPQSVPVKLMFSFEERPAGLLVSMSGELGMPPNTERLRTELMRISKAQPRVVVVNLAGLTFMSSLGIGILAEAHRDLRKHDGRIRLCALQPRVMEVLQRCRMNKVFEIFENPEEAFAAV
jgi:anti-anti-sigma factor